MAGMRSYREWNRALALFITTGVPRGTKLYLSVDDDLLERIGREFSLTPTGGSGLNDFLVAVREEVIGDGRVHLSRLQGRDSEGLPKGVAFLGATVLAAYQMADEETISERNYFKRLQEVLGLHGERRPPGMQSGDKAEEPLWKDWNLWLMERGFLPTAQRSRGGATTYINYPICQSLLRRTDKDRLRRLFAEKCWSAQWDDMTLFAHVRREAQGLSKHLKEVLESRQRYEALAEAIQEVYLQWLDEGAPTPGKSGGAIMPHSKTRNLFAGLYRTEDPFLGQADYYLYPKQLRGRQLESVQIQLRDNVDQLRDERPGWYFPLECPVNPTQLEGGARYQITEPADLDFLILPARDFWILIPDPDNPDSGARASWGTPSLGTPFILLCKKELLSDIQRLRDERLIEWSGEPQSVFDTSSWVEIHQCMVISQAWDGVFINNQALKDALQPSVRLSISFSGGLRVPQQCGWLEGYSPQVTVFGFSPTAKLQVTRLSEDGQIVGEKSQKTNTPISVNFPSRGDYLVEATCAGESSQRIVKIVGWSELELKNPKKRLVVPVGFGNQICGSVIEEVSQAR